MEVEGEEEERGEALQWREQRAQRQRNPLTSTSSPVFPSLTLPPPPLSPHVYHIPAPNSRPRRVSHECKRHASWMGENKFQLCVRFLSVCFFEALIMCLGLMSGGVRRVGSVGGGRRLVGTSHRLMQFAQQPFALACRRFSRVSYPSGERPTGEVPSEKNKTTQNKNNV